MSIQPHRPAIRHTGGARAPGRGVRRTAPGRESIAHEGDDPGLLAEAYWAGLHGLVTLMRGGRLPAEAHERRLALLTGHLAAGAS